MTKREVLSVKYSEFRYRWDQSFLYGRFLFYYQLVFLGWYSVMGNIGLINDLGKFYNEYKKCRPDRKYCASIDIGYFSYFTYIDPVRQALVDRLYQRACNETYSLLHYDYFLQRRVMNRFL